MTVNAIAEVLGGRKVLKRKIGTAEELVRITREGLPVDILRELAEELDMDRRVIASLVGIPVRTLSRRLSSHSRLSAAESDRSVRLARIVAQAKDTFDDPPKAATWLQAPNRVLKGQRPIELLDTDAGVQQVETVLGRIAYGIYS
jgi:putative toxin-antitoxin system antitoxin component (TIGR02293 family)